MPNYVTTSAYAPTPAGFAAALAATREGAHLILDSDVTGTGSLPLKKRVRLESDGGKLIGCGLAVGSNSDLLGIESVQASGVGFTFGAGASRATATDIAAIDSKGKGIVVSRETADVALMRPYVTGAADHAFWFLGSEGTVIENALAENNHGKGFEFYGAKRFKASFTSRGNGGLGAHFLKADGGLITEAFSHNNRHNGMDSNSSMYLTFGIIHCSGNGAPGAVEQEGGAEGCGLLLFQSHHIDVGLAKLWNNAQGQPNNRDGLNVSCGKDSTKDAHHITVTALQAFDNQAVHTQRFGFGIGGKRVGGAHDIRVNMLRCPDGDGNLRGSFGFVRPENVDLTRDNISIAA